MYFKIVLTEVGWHEAHNHYYLVCADSPEEAKQKASDFANDWYGEDCPGEYIEELNHWSFFGGEVVVTISDPIKTTLKKYFNDHLQNTYLIK